jgi:asparagine synthase (glutamine-hydrolysing)
MSGLAGIFLFNSRPILLQQLHAMGSTLSHRGLDGISYYSKNSIGLVHCMLYDTPESLSENLPNITKDEKFVLTFDGRIDNRKELYTEMGLIKTLATLSDSDLILAAYQKWNKKCVDYLLGDFVFALWDQKQRKLFCARDHFGVKPFYYYFSEHFFAFASEIKGLFAIPEIPRYLNEERVADFLASIVIDKESTFYKNIYRLPPAHFLEIQQGKINLQCYYEVGPRQLNCRDTTEYEELFRELFIDAVRCRIRSAFPVGSYLSGGLDSSSIVCVAAGPLHHEIAQPLHTFSGIFNEIQSCDERKYFQPILDRYKITPHFLSVDKIHPGESFEKIAIFEDEPFWAPHVFMSMDLLQMARESGVRVLLDGHDGDAAVSYGYGLFTELALSGKIGKLLREFKKIGNATLPGLIKKILRIYSDVLLNAFPTLRYLLRERREIRENLKTLNPPFRQQTDIKNRLRNEQRILPCPGQNEATYHKLNLTQPIHSYALEFLEKLSSYSNLSNRYPFFDKRILEFCLSLPAEQKFADGKNRSIVRRSLSDFLPESIRERKTKTDFTPSLVNGYTKMDKKWLDSAIDSIPEMSYKYANKEYCLLMYMHFKENEGGGQQKYLTRLLSIISLARWIGKL